MVILVGFFVKIMDGFLFNMFGLDRLVFFGEVLGETRRRRRNVLGRLHGVLRAPVFNLHF